MLEDYECPEYNDKWMYLLPKFSYPGSIWTSTSTIYRIHLACIVRLNVNLAPSQVLLIQVSLCTTACAHKRSSHAPRVNIAKLGYVHIVGIIIRHVVGRRGEKWRGRREEKQWSCTPEVRTEISIGMHYLRLSHIESRPIRMSNTPCLVPLSVYHDVTVEKAMGNTMYLGWGVEKNCWPAFMSNYKKISVLHTGRFLPWIYLGVKQRTAMYDINKMPIFTAEEPQCVEEAYHY